MSEQDSERKPDNKERGRWLRDQGLQLLVLLASTFTATCYLVGRASLLGWYEAAGIPALVFSWPVQDVVIRGFADAETWLLFAGTVIAAALYIILLEFSDPLVRGLGWIVRLPLKALRIHDPLARVWGRVWAAASARTARREGDGKRKERDKSLLLGSVTVVLVLVILTGIYFLGGLVLFNPPYQASVKAFRAQYLAATGRVAPSALGVRSGPQTRPISKRPEAVGDQKSLAGYAFVKLTAAGEERGQCGWLVQASGGQVLLLAKEGLVMKNFGGGAYEWRTASPESCEQPSKLETK